MRDPVYANLLFLPSVLPLRSVYLSPVVCLFEERYCNIPEVHLGEGACLVGQVGLGAPLVDLKYNNNLFLIRLYLATWSWPKIAIQNFWWYIGFAVHGSLQIFTKTAVSVNDAMELNDVASA